MTATDPRYRQLRTRNRGTDLVPRAPAWTAQAVCARVGQPADWEPDPGDAEAVQAAVQACAHCPVRSECLEDALARPELARGSIRGGLTEPQRRRLQRSRTRSARNGADRTRNPHW